MSNDTHASHGLGEAMTHLQLWRCDSQSWKVWFYKKVLSCTIAYRIVAFQNVAPIERGKAGLTRTSLIDCSRWKKGGTGAFVREDLISLWIMGNKWSFKKKQRLAAARWLFRTKRMKCGITHRSLSNNKKSYSCRIPAEFMRWERRFPSRDRGCAGLLLQRVTSAPCSQLRGVSWGKELLLYVDPLCCLTERKKKRKRTFSSLVCRIEKWSEQFITNLLVSVQFWPGLYLICARRNY